MLEWLKRHAWKACIRQKRIRGSNPRLSARKKGDENRGGRYREALAQQESPSLRKGFGEVYEANP